MSSGYSEKYSCPYDGFTIDELEPRNFSFNSPHGACPTCTGLGTKLGIDPALLIPNPDKSLDRALLGIGGLLSTDASWRMKIIEAVMKVHGWDFTAPVRKLPAEALEYLLYAKYTRSACSRGTATSVASTYKANPRGTVTNLERRYRVRRTTSRPRSRSSWSPSRKRDLRRQTAPEILAVTIGDKSIWDISTMSIKEALRWAQLARRDAQRLRAADRLPGGQGDRGAARVPGRRRGLDYLTLDRTSDAVRAVRPSGSASRPASARRAHGRPLHPRRTVHRAAPARQRQVDRDADRLRDLGNTVLVVEHDEETIRTADWVVDIGPGAGSTAGRSSPTGHSRRCWPSRARSPAPSSAASVRSPSRSDGARAAARPWS